MSRHFLGPSAYLNRTCCKLGKGPHTLCNWRVHFTRLRQYPFYSKKAPPSELSKHIDDSTFEKSQNYGRDKARYAFVSGLLRQAIDSALLHYGIYAWAWTSAGTTIGKFGYGSEYEVRIFFVWWRNGESNLYFRRYCNLTFLQESFSFSPQSNLFLSLCTRPLYWKRNTVSTRRPQVSSWAIWSKDGF